MRRESIVTSSYCVVQCFDVVCGAVDVIPLLYIGHPAPLIPDLSPTSISLIHPYLLLSFPPYLHLSHPSILLSHSSLHLSHHSIHKSLISSLPTSLTPSLPPSLFPSLPPSTAPSFHF